MAGAWRRSVTSESHSPDKVDQLGRREASHVAVVRDGRAGVATLRRRLRARLLIQAAERVRVRAALVKLLPDGGGKQVAEATANVLAADGA